MKNLTKGKPGKIMLQFAIPLFIGNLLQLAYSITDTRIVGQFLGEQKLASVGATTALSSMLISFLYGLTNGFAILVAMRFGKKDEKGMKQAEGNAVLLSLLFTLVLTVLSVSFLPQILRWLKVPKEQYADGYTYIRIILLGMAATMFYNMCAGFLRAVGDTMTPLLFLVLSSLLNIGLDLLFIAVFDLDVAGAAYATVFSQVISFVLCVWYLFRKYPLLRFSLSDLKPEQKTLGFLLSSGLSMGLMNALVNFGSLTLQTGINGLGEQYIVAHTGARKITEIFMMPIGVLAMTCATYCSQNYGAKKEARLYEGVRDAMALAVIWCLLAMLMAFTIAPFLVRFVVATKTALIIDTASRYLRINTSFYILCAGICIGRNTLQGVGVRKTPVLSSFLELIGKIAAVRILVPRMAYEGIVWTEPIVWIIMILPILASLCPRYFQWRRVYREERTNWKNIPDEPRFAGHPKREMKS